MSFFKKYQENQYLLNDQEIEIIKFLIENIEEVKNETLKEIAIKRFVSPNTIVRMAKKLDFQGFSELKFSLLQAKADEKRKPTLNFSLSEEVLQTEKLIQREKIDLVIEAIKKAEHVSLFACGPSKFPCEEMKEKLRLLGIISSVYYEPHVMKQRAKRLKKEDVVFVVSLSGETKTLVDATSLAKLSSATIISITGLSQNTLASLADESLYAYYHPLKIGDVDVTSRISIHYLLNYIFEQLVSVCFSTHESVEE